MSQPRSGSVLDGQTGQPVKEVWSKDSKFAFKFTKFLLWPLGLWFTNCDSPFSLFRLILAVSTQIYIVTIQLTALARHCGNPDDAVDYVMLAVCALMALSKIATFRLHMDKMRKVFSSALEDWRTIEETERKILMPFARYAKSVFFLQMGFCYLSNTLINIGSLPFLAPPASNQTAMEINDSAWTNNSVQGTTRELPLKTGCILAHLQDGVYATLYVFECLTTAFSAHGNVGCDLVVITFLMYICGQIELLKKDLREIGYDRDKSGTFVSDARSRIQRHSTLLSLARDLNLAVSGMLIVQLFFNAWTNLMLGLRILMALEQNLYFEAVRPAVALNVLMLQLYLLSQASDRLSQLSESVVDAVYDALWYDMPAELRRDFHFVMMRANKPLYLVAVDFYAMNMENFKNVLKGSFSYFSIVRVLFDA